MNQIYIVNALTVHWVDRDNNLFHLLQLHTRDRSKNYSHTVQLSVQVLYNIDDNVTSRFMIFNLLQWQTMFLTSKPPNYAVDNGPWHMSPYNHLTLMHTYLLPPIACMPQPYLPHYVFHNTILNRIRNRIHLRHY